MNIHFKSHGRIFNTAVSSLTASLFFFQSIMAFALPAAPLPKAAASLNLSIPETLGKIESRSLTGETPLIIYIQDAHAQPAAQRNIQALIEHLAEGKHATQIFAEGAFDKLDPSVLELFPSRERNRDLAEYLLELGELTGVEMYALEHSGSGLQVYGAEDESVYAESFQLFRELKESGETNRSDIKAYRKVLEEACIRVLGSELEAFMLARSGWQEDPGGAARYFELISGFSKRHLELDFSDGRNQFDWPALTRLNKLHAAEAGFSIEIVRAEWERLESRLAASANKETARYFLETLSSFLEPGSEAAKNRAWIGGRYPAVNSLRTFFEFFYRQAGRDGIDLSYYPELLRFAGIEILKEEIDSGDLFSEIEIIENKLEEKLAASSEEKNLIELSADLALMEKLLSLTLTRAGYEHYLARRAKLSADIIKTRFSALAAGTGETLPLFSESALWMAQEFYLLSRKRDEIILEKTLQKTGKDNAGASVLVAGGFHSEGIKELMKEKGVSFVVIRPHVPELDKSGLYEKAMMGAYAGIEAQASTLVKQFLLLSAGVYERGPLDRDDQRIRVALALQGAARKWLGVSTPAEIYAVLSEAMARSGMFEGSKVVYDENAGALYMIVPVDGGPVRINILGEEIAVPEAARSEMRSGQTPKPLKVSIRGMKNGFSGDREKAFIVSYEDFGARLPMMLHQEALQLARSVYIYVNDPTAEQKKNLAEWRARYPIRGVIAGRKQHDYLWARNSLAVVSFDARQSGAVISTGALASIDWKKKKMELLPAAASPRITEWPRTKVVYIGQPNEKLLREIKIYADVAAITNSEDERAYDDVFNDINQDRRPVALVYNETHHEDPQLDAFRARLGAAGIAYKTYAFPGHDLRRLDWRFDIEMAAASNLGRILFPTAAAPEDSAWVVHRSELRAPQETVIHEPASINVYKTGAEMGAAAADRVVATARQYHDQGGAVIILPTGSTPTAMYRSLLELFRQDPAIDFSNVKFFNLDEYVNLEAGHPLSYQFYMDKIFYEKLDAIDPARAPKKENRNVVSTEFLSAYAGYDPASGPEEAARIYEQRLQDALLALGRTKSHLTVLGIGGAYPVEIDADNDIGLAGGHVGFNEPGSTVTDRTRVIPLTDKTKKDTGFRFTNIRYRPDGARFSPRVPDQAITLGIANILESDEILLLANGEEKSLVINEAYRHEPNKNFPATFLKYHPNVRWILDEEAASRLPHVQTPWVTQPDFDWQLENVRLAVMTALKRTPGLIISALAETDLNALGMPGDVIARFGGIDKIKEDAAAFLAQHIVPFDAADYGKTFDDSLLPQNENIVLISPHPDDDVITSGAMIRKLLDRGNQVHVIYMVGGENAVRPDDARETFDRLRAASPSTPEAEHWQEAKILVREGEARKAVGHLGVPAANTHFLRLNYYYRRGFVDQKAIGEDDLLKAVAELNLIDPQHLFYSAEQDPHGAHGIAADVIRLALQRPDFKPSKPEIKIWGYRGAYEEWPLQDSANLVVLPFGDEMMKLKVKAILEHKSQINPLFPSFDRREFWERARDRNGDSGRLLQALGYVKPAEPAYAEVFRIFTRAEFTAQKRSELRTERNPEREAFYRRNHEAGIAFPYTAESLSPLQTRPIRTNAVSESRSVVASIPKESELYFNLRRFTERLRKTRAAQNGKVIFNIDSSGDFNLHVTWLSAGAFEKIRDEELIQETLKESGPVEIDFAGSFLSPVDGGANVAGYDEEDRVLTFREVTTGQKPVPVVHSTIATVDQALDPEERQEWRAAVREFEDEEFGRIRIDELHLVRHFNDLLRDAQSISAYPLKNPEIVRAVNQLEKNSSLLVWEKALEVLRREGPAQIIEVDVVLARNVRMKLPLYRPLFDKPETREGVYRYIAAWTYASAIIYGTDFAAIGSERETGLIDIARIESLLAGDLGNIRDSLGEIKHKPFGIGDYANRGKPVRIIPLAEAPESAESLAQFGQELKDAAVSGTGRYLGIDVGGGSAKFGVVEQGRLIELPEELQKIPSVTAEPEDGLGFARRIAAHARAIQEKLGKIDGVGIVTPGAADIPNNRMVTIGQLTNVKKWTDTDVEAFYNLVPEVTQALGLPPESGLVRNDMDGVLKGVLAILPFAKKDFLETTAGNFRFDWMGTGHGFQYSVAGNPLPSPTEGGHLFTDFGKPGAPIYDTEAHTTIPNLVEVAKSHGFPAVSNEVKPFGDAAADPLHPYHKAAVKAFEEFAASYAQNLVMGLLMTRRTGIGDGSKVLLGGGITRGKTGAIIRDLTYNELERLGYKDTVRIELMDDDEILEALRNFGSGYMDALGPLGAASLIQGDIHRSEVRTPAVEAESALSVWKNDYARARPYLGDYEARRWVAVHAAFGIYALMPAELDEALSLAVRGFVSRDLFYFPASNPLVQGGGTNTGLVPVTNRPVESGAGLSISILKTVPEAETHFFGVARLLAREPDGYIHEFVLDGDEAEIRRLERTFKNEYGYTNFAQRYRITAVSRKDLPKRVQDSINAVYKQARIKNSVRGAAEFAAENVTVTSDDPVLLADSFTAQGWLIHNDLDSNPAFQAYLREYEAYLALGMLDAALIKKLGGIKSLRKLISAANSLMADANWSLAMKIYQEDLNARIFYRSA